MSTITRLEDLETWVLARELYKKISPIVIRLREHKEFRFAEQMKSSSGSIMDNIAEGFGRNGTLEFINSLSVAKGESAELKSQLYRCLDDNYITQAEFDEYYSNNEIVSAKIGKLITYLITCELKGIKFKDRIAKTSSKNKT
jgi:four helix bundle protein